jgi:hypothetical protein
LIVARRYFQESRVPAAACCTTNLRPCRQHVIVEQLHGGNRQLVGIKARPGVATGAVDRGLQVALAELRAEAFQQPHLLVGQADLPLGGGLLQPAIMPGQQAVALPDATYATGGDLDAAQHQLLGNAHRPVAGIGQGVVQDRLLHRLGHVVVGKLYTLDRPARWE